MNPCLLEKLESQDIEIEIVSKIEEKMDEMWSFVHDKTQQYAYGG